jgi:4-hydroxybenzoyl-CoA reductase subunit beta
MLPFPSFSLESPDRLEDAVALLAEPGAMPIAGGTDVLPSMKQRLFEPTLTVSLRRLPLRDIEPLPGGGLALGAGLTLRAIHRNPLVRARWPALAAAAGTIGTPTIQNMGTLGGNVMLDTRCMYYNQPEGWRHALGYCLKRQGTICHVAPKGKGCYAAHSADTVPPLWLYGAEVELMSTSGVRRVAIRDLYRDDGMDWLHVQRGELLTRVLLPAPSGPVLHHKCRTREAIDYGWLLFGVQRDAGTFRAVLSAIGPRPIEVSGTTPEELAENAYKATQPLTTHLLPPPYRKRMVRVEVRRAAEKLL